MLLIPILIQIILFRMVNEIGVLNKNNNILIYFIHFFGNLIFFFFPNLSTRNILRYFAELCQFSGAWIRLTFDMLPKVWNTILFGLLPTIGPYL